MREGEERLAGYRVREIRGSDEGRETEVGESEVRAWLTPKPVTRT